MKLNTNLINFNQKMLPIVGLMMWGASFVLILISVVLIIDSQQMSSDINILKNDNKQFAIQAENLIRQNKQSLPSLNELQQLVKKVSDLNAVSGVKGDSISILLEQLEKALPKDTFLKSLEHHPRKGEMLITAVSTKANLLTHFLGQLEKNSHFERVMLVRQSKNDSNENEVQFDLRLLVSQ